jgi:hypothetical protein
MGSPPIESNGTSHDRRGRRDDHLRRGPAGHTLPVIATETFVAARGVSINGVLALTRLRVEDCDGGGNSTDDGGGCGGD